MNIIITIFYLLILSSSSIIGWLYGRTFTRRARNITDLEYCIRVLESEILVGNTPLPDALLNVDKKGKGSISKIFIDIREDLLQENRDDVYYSFLSLEKKLKNTYSLNKEEIEIVFFLGKILGKTDRLDQEKKFNFIKNQINELSSSANLAREKNEKLYPSLGVLVGLSIIIILI